MANETTGRESDKFMLRLPEGMRERIKAAAEANNRSMNAEIVSALEEKYPAPLAEDEMGLIQHYQSVLESYKSDYIDKDNQIPSIISNEYLNLMRLISDMSPEKINDKRGILDGLHSRIKKSLNAKGIMMKY